MGLKQQSLLNGPLVKNRLKTLIGFYKNTPPCTPRAGVSVFMKSVCSSQSFCFTLSACGGLFYMLPDAWFLCCVCRLWNNLHLFFISFCSSHFLNALIIFQLFYPSVSPSHFILVFHSLSISRWTVSVWHDLSLNLKAKHLMENTVKVSFGLHCGMYFYWLLVYTH